MTSNNDIVDELIKAIDNIVVCPVNTGDSISFTKNYINCLGAASEIDNTEDPSFEVEFEKFKSSNHLSEEAEEVDDDDDDEYVTADEYIESENSGNPIESIEVEDDEDDEDDALLGSEEIRDEESDDELTDNEHNFESQFVQVGVNEYHVNSYLGEQWDAKIRALDTVEPMGAPDHMTTIPHPWQLKGAAQAIMLCESIFKGIIVGDEMGLGKTLLAVLAMYETRGMPGSFHLVVCPKAVQLQWLAEIVDNFEAGYAMRAFILDDPTLTAHQLLAGDYDVVITSYEFLEQNKRPLDKVHYNFNGIQNPKRVTTALHSPIYRLINQPIKYVVFDEVQRIKNVEGRRHIAALNLFYQGAILLSGTFLDNKWSDISGLLSFIQGHPWRTQEVFKKTFACDDSNGRNELDGNKIKLLQKILLAMTVARPATLLVLPGIRRFRAGFDLNESDSFAVLMLVEKFTRAQRARKNSQMSNNIKNPLAWAIKAQQRSLHPILDNIEDLEIGQRRKDNRNATEPLSAKTRTTLHEMILSLDSTEVSNSGRADWIKTLSSSPDIVFRSERVVTFLKCYDWARYHYPDQKIVVFSGFLKFLDILSIALKIRHHVLPLRYDGSVRAVQREIVRKDFKAAHPSIPLLITAGAGGVGLNMTEASILIQTEPWWNGNTELQAHSRIYRQGQIHEVKVIRLEASNSAIDTLILSSQISKTRLNQRLMAPIRRAHDVPVQIPQLAQRQGLEPMDCSRI